MNDENSAKLPPDFKKRWVAALRSGEYKQTTYELYNKDRGGYCCLGVAGKIQGYSDDYLDGVACFSGPCPKIPKILIGNKRNNDTVDELTDMNDGQEKSFAEIADWIEANL